MNAKMFRLENATISAVTRNVLMLADDPGLMIDVVLIVTTEFVSMELEFLCLAHYLHYIFILD